MPDLKPAKTYAEQLAILRGRGLAIPDEAFALHCLEHHNYYRLSAYRFPLTVPGDADAFRPGIDFGSLWGLYEFDRHLRQHLVEALKLIEISVRARWAYVLGHAHGAQAFENVSLFTSAAQHAECLEKLDEELNRSDEVFVGHYRRKHGMPRPPIWATCEVMSFGLLSRLYANTGPFKLRKEISRTYRLFPDTMKSFLEHATHVRNLCAHHCRVWNRRLTVTMTIPLSQPAAVLSSLHPPEDRRLYNTLVLLGHFSDVISPGHTWTSRLVALIEGVTFPVAPEMGFPADWKSRPFWQPHFPTP